MTVRAPPMVNSTTPLHGFGPPRDIYNHPSRQTCSWMDRGKVLTILYFYFPWSN